MKTEIPCPEVKLALEIQEQEEKPVIYELVEILHLKWVTVISSTRKEEIIVR